MLTKLDNPLLKEVDDITVDMSTLTAPTSFVTHASESIHPSLFTMSLPNPAMYKAEIYAFALPPPLSRERSSQGMSLRSLVIRPSARIAGINPT